MDQRIIDEVGVKISYVMSKMMGGNIRYTLIYVTQNGQSMSRSVRLSKNERGEIVWFISNVDRVLILSNNRQTRYYYSNEHGRWRDLIYPQYSLRRDLASTLVCE